MSKLKNAVYYIRATIISFVCIFGIFIFFFSSDFLANLLANGLHLKVTPSYIGGDIAEDFFDDVNDDNGAGNLRYPTNNAFKEGALDLVRYTVHKPVFDAKWQQNPDYWQMDLEYKSGPVNVKTVMVYIDIDGDKKGSVKTLDCGAENVTFSSEHPWDIAVRICNGAGKVYNSKKEFICNAETSVDKEDKKIKIRIPLTDKGLQKIYTAEKTYHYVITGAYSEWDEGNFMPIESDRALSHGELANASDYNSLIPKIYDILDISDDSKTSQYKQLSSWNKGNSTAAILTPVEVTMNSSAAPQKSRELISEIKSAYRKTSMAPLGQEKSQYREKLAPALAAFNIGETDKAESLLEKIVEEQPENYLAMAYYGSCVAIRGGNSPVVQAVKLVNDSYIYLDKAAELSQGRPEELEVLMNRASVSESVPNAVFGKALTGAEDYIKCATLFKRKTSTENFTDSEKLFLSYLYASASACYKKAGRETEELLNLKEAEKLWKQTGKE